MEDWQVQRDELKKQGDDAFRLGQLGSAIRCYTEALSLDPEHAVILSNRSAAYLKNGQKSAALHDAQACVKFGTLGLKGQGRLAAALQALGRFRPALAEWQSILEKDANYAAAVQGAKACKDALPPDDEHEQKDAKPGAKKEEAGDNEEDDLADFFDEVEEAAEAVAKQKVVEAATTSHEIFKHKTNLGSAKDQISRLLADNYQWRNLNPFFVFDLPHTATDDELQRRYKALSLLLHPDKNRNEERAQEAYDQVLQAKVKLLDDPIKANHVRQLIEEGMKQGERDFKKNGGTLEEAQSKAVHKIFAEIEYKRRLVLERERQQEFRVRQQEEEGVKKEKDAVKFDKEWKQEERVGKRVGNWRDFAKKKKPKV